MNTEAILSRLKKAYPNKIILQLPEKSPQEIICEVEPTSQHSNYNLAVIIINKSAPHYHKLATETYKVIEGDLDLFVDGVKHHLSESESFVIHPGEVHYAIGNETWIECESRPGWTPEDHILV